MKAEFIDDKVVFYLNDIIAIYDEERIKTLFLKIKKRYGFSFCGNYLTYIYTDKNLGTVLEVFEKDSNELFKYLRKTKMNLKYKVDSYFLLEINNINFLEMLKLKSYRIFYYNNYFYIKLLDKMICPCFLEYSKIYYLDPLEVEREGIELR